MLNKIKHSLLQFKRDRMHTHQSVTMEELLDLSPYCKLDNRTLRVLSLHSDKKVYAFFRGLLRGDGVVDMSTICNVDVRIRKNSMVQELTIRYWILGHSKTFVHKTDIIMTPEDTAHMIQLGYGA